MSRSVWGRLGLGAPPDEQPSSVNRQLSDAEKNAAEMRRPTPVDTSPPQRTPVKSALRRIGQMLRRPSSDEDRFSPVRPARADSEDLSFALTPPSTPPRPRRILRLSTDDDASLFEISPDRPLARPESTPSAGADAVGPRADAAAVRRAELATRELIELLENLDDDDDDDAAGSGDALSPLIPASAARDDAHCEALACVPAGALEPRYPLRDPPAWMRAAGLSDRAALARKVCEGFRVSLHIPEDAAQERFTSCTSLRAQGL